ncbi:MAG: DUF3391 domain-containing protein [Pseudomonadota bacterium]
MSIKKIKISELKIGMFIVGLDISWIRSPFLKHSRWIKKSNDIKLLTQAGVKEVSIDSNKTINQETSVANKNPQDQQNNIEKKAEEKVEENSSIEGQQDTEVKVEAESTAQVNIKHKETSLLDEVDSALLLKQQAREAFSNLSDSIKNNKPIHVKEVLPIVDESINSLIRNNQALLTLMHMQRREKELFAHSFSVMSLLLSLAINMGYSDEQLKKFGLAALLHDLGWSKIPLHLLAKNKRYTENEKKVIQQHIIIIVQQLLSAQGNDYDIIQLISEHHERGDGSGYPKGMKLNEISDESSLLALVDNYDELIHGLSDQPGVIPSLALKLLYKETLKDRFHKQQIEQLVSLLGIYPLTSAVKLDSGEKAVVFEINRNTPLKPQIKVFYDKTGRAVAQPYIIDLNKDEENREIAQVLDLSDQKQDPLNLLVVKEQGLTQNG